MKVLDLQCQHLHLFEGWFASEDEYQSQRSQNLVQCPVCGDSHIHKMLSAPRLNLLTSRLEQTPPVEVSPSNELVPLSTQDTSESHDFQAQAAWLHMVQHVIANTEDVGQGFAEEARKMHYGKTEERNIRGQVSVEETRSLLEEGINVLPLPLPAALKGPVH
jgi:hypothetical protein